MGYESHIKLITSQIESALVQGVDGEIFKTVQKVGVTVDRDELLRALAYDRGQYQKGYADRDAEIVRCRNCKDACIYDDDGVICVHVDSNGNDKHPADWFCADGERQQ